jgi:hypothetical protein
MTARRDPAALQLSRISPSTPAMDHSAVHQITTAGEAASAPHGMALVPGEHLTPLPMVLGRWS